MRIAGRHERSRAGSPKRPNDHRRIRAKKTPSPGSSMMKSKNRGVIDVEIAF